MYRGRRFTAYDALPRRDDLPTHNATSSVIPRVHGRVHKDDYLVCGYRDGLYKLSTIKPHISRCYASAMLHAPEVSVSMNPAQPTKTAQKPMDDSSFADRKYCSNTECGKCAHDSSSDKNANDDEKLNTKVPRADETKARDETKYCIFCGTTLPSVAKFCSVCGKIQ